MLPFDLFAFGDVKNYSYHAKRFPRLIVVALPTGMYPANPAIGPKRTIFQVGWLPVFQRITPVVFHAIVVGGMQSFVKVFLGYFPGGIHTKYLTRLRIPKHSLVHFVPIPQSHLRSL